MITLFKQRRINFTFEKVKQQNSKQNSIIQLCYIFTGFGHFSRESYDEFSRWRNHKKSEIIPSLFNNANYEKIEISKSNQNRFELIDYIAEECKKRNISVSLNTNKYLKSYEGELPINFWLYEPQGDYDKAPIKRKH